MVGRMSRGSWKPVSDRAVAPALACRGAPAASHLSGRHHLNLCLAKEGLAQPAAPGRLQPSQNGSMSEDASPFHY